MNRLLQDSSDAKDLIAGFGGLSGFCDANSAVLHYKHDPQGRHKVALVGNGPDWDDVSGAELLVAYLQKQVEVVMQKQKSEVKNKNADAASGKRKNNGDTPAAVNSNNNSKAKTVDHGAGKQGVSNHVGDKDQTQPSRGVSAAAKQDVSDESGNKKEQAQIQMRQGDASENVQDDLDKQKGSGPPSPVKAKSIDGVSGKQKAGKCKHGAGCKNKERCK